MTPELHRRLGAALFGFALLLSALVGGVLWSGHVWLENSVLDAIMRREAQTLMALPQRGGPAPSSAQGITLYRAVPGMQPPLPPPLLALQPGSHRDVQMDGREFHVLVGQQESGQRYYIAYDVSEFAHREAWLGLIMVATLLAAALVSWVAGRRLSARLLSPVSSVVARIGTLDDDHLQALQRKPTDGELGMIIDALNRLIGEVQHRVARERSFAAAAGHELRTPLTSIRITAESLLAAYPAERERLGRIERAVRTASNTLDTLMATARHDTETAAQWCNMGEQLPAWAEPYLTGAGTQVSWTIEPVTMCVPATALSVIFTNLLRNALAAAPEGHVHISLQGDRLRVDDDGDGIDPDLLEHAFEPGIHGRAGGSGIGLYLSRLLAQRHGWKLELSNRDGGGVCAELRLRGVEIRRDPARS